MSESAIQLGIIAMNVKATGKYFLNPILYLLSRWRYYTETRNSQFVLYFVYSDVDDDCAGTLICKQRSGFEAVPGCSGEGGSTDLYAKDICVKPTLTDIVLKGDCTNCALCTGDW